MVQKHLITFLSFIALFFVNGCGNSSLTPPTDSAGVDREVREFAWCTDNSRALCVSEEEERTDWTPIGEPWAYYLCARDQGFALPTVHFDGEMIFEPTDFPTRARYDLCVLINPTLASCHHTVEATLDGDVDASLLLAVYRWDNSTQQFIDQKVLHGELRRGSDDPVSGSWEFCLP